MASSYSNIGIVYKRIGDYPKSVDYYFQALELHDSINNIHGIATVYSNLGVLYDVMNELDKALDFFQKAKKINDEHPQDETTLSLMTNMSIIYEKKKAYDRALQLQLEAIEFAKSINAKTSLQNALNNTGFIYLQMEEFEKAKTYLLKSLEIGASTKLLGVRARSYFNLARVSLAQKNIDEAIYFAQEEAKNADSLNSIPLKRDVHELFTRLFQRKGNYKKALEHQQLANQYRDSLFNEQKAKEISQLETRFKVYEKDREIEQKKVELGLLEKQVNLEKRWKGILIIALLLAALSSFLLYYNNQLRKRKNIIKAIKFSSIDYLLKPIDLEELQLAVEKAKQKQADQLQKAQFDVLLSHLHNTNAANRKICLSTSDGLEFLSTNEILYCQANGSYTTFHLKDDRTIVVSKNLKEYENLLGDHHFMRVHNKYLINLQEVKRFVKTEGGYILMNNGEHVSISVKKREEFLLRMGEIMNS